MNHTLSTAEALGLDFLDFYTVPDDNSSNVYDSYKRSGKRLMALRSASKLAISA
jgi:hypothetical protein